jgi:hypothetical protein
VLPGHGEPFTGARARCAALVAHHVERAAACIDALADGPRTAYEVARIVFGDHHAADGERFATTETLAHHKWASTRGEVVADAPVVAPAGDEREDLVRWTRT